MAVRFGFRDAATMDAIAASMMTFPHDHLNQLQCFPGTSEVLTHLRESYRLGTMSNWHWSLADFLTSCGIPQHLELAVTSGRVGYRKSHPKIFENALALANIAPEQKVMLGDSYESDVIGAQGAGIPAMLVDRWD